MGLMLGNVRLNLVDRLSRLLLSPPALGRRALLYAIILLAIPTGLRLVLDDLVGGRLPFFPYMPSIIVAGALLRWRHAAGVALASWVIADLMFMEPRFAIGFGTIELVGFMVFTLSAALILMLVEAVRTIVENSLRPTRPEGFSAPIVFSVDRGQAWASWYGSHSWVRLGPEDEVAEMMEDFLAQLQLGKRLSGAAGKDRADP